MIIKKSSLFLIFLICAIGSRLFYVKYGVMQIEDRIVQTKREIIEARRDHHILKAEWKALTTPERIQRLTEKYLKTAQMDPEQLREYDPSIFHGETAKYKQTKKLSQLISEIMAQRAKEDKSTEESSERGEE